jgi:hypothetical protein
VTLPAKYLAHVYTRLRRAGVEGAVLCMGCSTAPAPKGDIGRLCKDCSEAMRDDIAEGRREEARMGHV